MNSIAKKNIADIRVLYIETKRIPHGIPDAFHQLEKAIGSLKKRKFLGVMFSDSRYWAAVELTEIDNADALGLPVGTVPGGHYSYKNINGWSMKTISAQISAGFKEISTRSKIDHSRPHIEFYRSQRELILLAPASRE